MPPFNAVRYDRLADAAIEVLARQGARGLTHRAVDAQAGEPPAPPRGTSVPGTHSWRRWWSGRATCTSPIWRAPRAGPVEPVRRPTTSPSMVHAASTGTGPGTACLELSLEATRRPDLDAAVRTRPRRSSSCATFTGRPASS